VLGTSDGSPNQRYVLAHPSLILRPIGAAQQTSRDIVLLTQLGATIDAWKLQESLAFSSGGQKDYVIEIDENDQATVIFGDGSFGAIPANGAQIQATYRVGGGAVGNTPAGLHYQRVPARGQAGPGSGAFWEDRTRGERSPCRASRRRLFRGYQSCDHQSGRSVGMRLLNIAALAHSDGNRIDLTWTNPAPAAFPSVRVARREGTHPVTPDDGVTVVQGAGLLSVSDLGLKGETVYYYTLFPFHGAPPQFEGDPHNRASALATAPYDFAGQMYALLPALYHRYDEAQLPSSGSGALTGALKGQLRRFLDLPGSQLDQIYSLARAASASTTWTACRKACCRCWRNGSAGKLITAWKWGPNATRFASRPRSIRRSA
jgi:hypothetical protein